MLEPAAADLTQALRRARARLGFQNAQRLGLPLQHFQTFGSVRRGDDDFVKHTRLAIRRRAELTNLTRHVRVDGAVERNDTTESGDRVGAHGHAVSLEQVAVGAARAGDAARVGVLDDDARRIARRVVARAAVRGVSIQIVIVAHFLTVVLDGSRHTLTRGFRERAVRVHGRRLVRVLAVS